MKATLLIKNIENLYTCSEDDIILKNAFVAMHHDRIIDMGVHDPKEWIDDATRVIDARGECVVPAFIDCHFNTPDDRLDGDRMRKESDALYLMRMNGIRRCGAGNCFRKCSFPDISRKFRSFRECRRSLSNRRSCYRAA